MDFKAQSEAYFGEVSARRLNAELLEDDNLSQQERNTMSEFVRLVNIAYFGGSLYEEADKIKAHPGLNLFQNKGKHFRFWDYYQSIMREPLKPSSSFQRQLKIKQ